MHAETFLHHFPQTSPCQRPLLVHSALPPHSPQAHPGGTINRAFVYPRRRNQPPLLNQDLLTSTRTPGCLPDDSDLLWLPSPLPVFSIYISLSSLVPCSTAMWRRSEAFNIYIKNSIPHMLRCTPSSPTLFPCTLLRGRWWSYTVQGSCVLMCHLLFP